MNVPVSLPLFSALVSLGIFLAACGTSTSGSTGNTDGGHDAAGAGGSQSVDDSGGGGAGAGGSSATGAGGTGAGGTGAGGSSAGGAGGSAAGGVGGSDASTDAGSPGDSGPAFSPCPTDGGVCKILPLGDSITYGLDSTTGGGYRVELFHDALNDHKNITFTGSQMSGPATVDGVPFPQDNEGHSGWTIAEIQTLVPTPALQPMPDIILLMAGTNDMYTTANEMGAPQRLGSLIDTIVMDAPNALLVVAQLTPLGNASYEMNVEAYNASIPAVVQQRVSAGKHILLVDMHTGFDVATMLDTVDMIHPNDQGYIFMGDKWYGAIKGVLP